MFTSENYNRENAKKTFCEHFLNFDRFTCLQVRFQSFFEILLTLTQFDAQSMFTEWFCVFFVFNVLISIFYSTINMKIAMQSHTHEYFKSISDNAIIFVCVALKHFLREWKTDRLKKLKFESFCVNNAWCFVKHSSWRHCLFLTA